MSRFLLKPNSLPAFQTSEVEGSRFVGINELCSSRRVRRAPCSDQKKPRRFRSQCLRFLTFFLLCLFALNRSILPLNLTPWQVSNTWVFGSPSCLFLSLGASNCPAVCEVGGGEKQRRKLGSGKQTWEKTIEFQVGFYKFSLEILQLSFLKK